MKTLKIQYLALLILTLIIASCNMSKKIKTIVEITPKVSVTSDEDIIFPEDALNNALINYSSNNKQYNIAKDKIIAQPICVKGVIYVLNDKGLITAFSKDNRKTLWLSNISDNSQQIYASGGIMHHNGKLYITNGSKHLVVVDAANGYELFRKAFPDIIKIKPVKLDEEHVIVQTVSNQLFVYNINQFTIKWQHEGLPSTLVYSYHVAPVVYDKQIFVNYNSGYFAALDKDNGNEQWFFNLSDDYDVSTPNLNPTTLITDPILDEQDLYIATSSNKIIKLNRTDGSVIWETNAFGIESISLISNNLFATNNANQVFALSLINGQVKWVSNLFDYDNKLLKNAIDFLPPFVVVNADKTKSLLVIGDNGKAYYFSFDDGVLKNEPTVINIINNVLYTMFSCCGDLYLVTNNAIVFPM